MEKSKKEKVQRTFWVQAGVGTLVERGLQAAVGEHLEGQDARWLQPRK